MHATDVLRDVPDRLHTVDIAFLEGCVELGVRGDDGLLFAGHAPAAASRTRATTRTASALARTSCTRTAQARAAAANVVTAAVASSRSDTGRGAASEPRRLPRNDLRLAPTSSGRPSRINASR